MTFDDCYNTANVAQEVSLLRAAGVVATFFCIGEPVSRTPAPFVELVRTFPLGDHTWSHPNLTLIQPAAASLQLSKGAAAIEQATGWGMVPLMRPPGGYSGNGVTAEAAKLGLAIIKWDVDTSDWDSNSTVASVVAQALTAHPGSIIVMHDRDLSVAALPAVIAALRGRGFSFVTVPELLGIPWQSAP